MAKSIDGDDDGNGRMRIFAVVAPILVTALLGVLLNTVSGLERRVDNLETERIQVERWRGEITAQTLANGQKVDQALSDMRATNQLLNEIRIDLAKRRP